MSVKAIIFAVVFCFFVLRGLADPVFGVLGYMLHYCLGPERQWWHAPFNSLGLRYSFILAAVTAVGIFRWRDRLAFRQLLVGQEKLALLTLAVLWLLTLFGPETVGRYVTTDHASVKMTKVILFCFMMTHVVTRTKDLDKVFWMLILASLVLGLQAYSIPRRAFTGGRLDGIVGGADFRDANALAGFLGAAISITGVMFLRSSWRGKVVCALSGAFAANTVVLCRSRGAFLAMAGAGVALALSVPRRYRLRVWAGLIVAGAGLLYVSDPQFLERIYSISQHADAVARGGQASDRSTMMRIEAWRGGMRMFEDHPLGVGPGNFNQNIGRYAPSVPGLSPHNTYLQAAAELGVPGLLLLLSLLGNAIWTARTVIRQSSQIPGPEGAALGWSACSLGAAVVAYATYGIFGHVMYVEAFWWYLMLPACLQRACENALEEQRHRSTEPALQLSEARQFAPF